MKIEKSFVNSVEIFNIPFRIYVRNDSMFFGYSAVQLQINVISGASAYIRRFFYSSREVKIIIKIFEFNFYTIFLYLENRKISISNLENLSFLNLKVPIRLKFKFNNRNLLSFKKFLLPK